MPATRLPQSASARAARLVAPGRVAAALAALWLAGLLALPALPGSPVLAAADANAERQPPTPADAAPADNGKDNDDAPSAAPESSALTERIRQAITDLDDDSFFKREAATDFLARAGRDAVGPVAQAALQGSAEASWRAVEILRRLAITRDMATERAAERALVMLKVADRRSVADRANVVLEKLKADRSERAIEMLTKLGAELNPNNLSIKLDQRWKGGDEGLIYLAWVQEYATVSIESSANVSGKAVKELRESIRGDLSVMYFGKALLGIRGIKSNYIPGVLVHEVVPTSGAGKAGLRERDIITSFDGTPITDFEQLVDAIRTKDVGDVVEIRVKRIGGGAGDYRTVKLKAKLTARPESLP